MTRTDAKDYRAPRLERFGSLRDATAGGSCSTPEVNQVNGMDQDMSRL